MHLQDSLAAHLLQEGRHLRRSARLGRWLPESWWAVFPGPGEAAPGQSARPRSPRPLAGRVGEAAWVKGVSGAHLTVARRRRERAEQTGGGTRWERPVPAGGPRPHHVEGERDGQGTGGAGPVGEVGERRREEQP